jgi:hypothetical protein
VAKASAAVAAEAVARKRFRQLAAQLLDGTANADGAGLLVRGQEYQPQLRQDFDPLVVGLLLRMARLAATAADALRDCPDPEVRRSAAVLAARAHPLRAAFND